MSAGMAITGRKHTHGRICRRAGSILLAAGMAAVMAAGCKDRAVDYDLDTEMSVPGGGGSLSQFADVGKWEDDWTVTTGDGKELELMVRAAVTVPDADGMSVIRTEQIVPDAEYKKQFLRAFFDHGEIYYHDPEHYTRAEMEDEIADLQEYIDMYRQNIADTQEEIRQELELNLEEMEAEMSRYRDLLETAKDTYTVAEDYDSCSSFAGYHEGLLCEASFEMSKDGNALYGVHIFPLMSSDHIPDSLRGFEETSMNSFQPLEGTVNECTYSVEEARELAEDFLSKAGVEGSVLTDEQQIIWRGYNENDSGEVTEEEYAAYGYRLSYAAGFNGTVFSGPGYQYDVISDLEYEEELPEDFMQGTPFMDILIEDEGVVQIALLYPVALEQISTSVDLLPLDTIQKIMQDEVAKHADAYDFSRTKTFSAMDLIYFRLKDDTDAGNFSYVPVWRLADTRAEGMYRHAVLVNAIDGTVIYVTDEI